MTQRQYSIRIGLDGKAEITRDFDDIAQKGEGAADSVSRAFDSASSSVGSFTKSAKDSAALFQTFGKSGGGVTTTADFGQTISRLKAEQDALTSAQKQAQMQMATQSGVNAAFGIGAVSKSAEDSAAAFGDYAVRAAALRAELDPLGVAQAKMNDEMADYHAMLANGLLTQDAHDKLVARSRATYDAAAASLREMGTGAEISVTRARELGFGMLHLGEGVATGNLSLRNLSNSAADFARASNGEGGLVGAFKAAGSAVTGFVFSTAGAIVGVAAVGAAASYVLYSNWQASRQLEAATEGLGKATGATAGEFALIARRASEYGTASLSAARDTEMAFAKTGVIGKESLGGLLELTDLYYRTSDQDWSKASDTMVAAFKEPQKAGLDFLAGLGALDDRTAQYIRTLVAEGNLVDAQKVLHDRIKTALQEETDKTTALGNALRFAGNAWSDYFDSFRPQSVEEQYAALEANLEAAKRLNAYLQSTGRAPASTAYEERQLQQFRQQHATELDASEKKSAADRAGQEADILSNLTGPLVRGAVPGFGERLQLQTQSTLLNRLQGNAQAMRLLGASSSDVATALGGVNRATSTYLDDNERAASSTALQIESLKHFSVAQRAHDAELQTHLALDGKTMTAEEALRRERQASALVYAQAARQIAEETIQLNMSRTAALAAGDAYLQNAASGQVAEAHAQATAEAFRDGVNVELRTRQILGEQVAQDYAAGAKQIEQLGRHARAQKAINDALAAGTITTGQANEQMQLEVALANLRIAKALALAEGYSAEANALQKIIDKLPAAFANDNAESHRGQALRTISGQSDQIELTKREIALQGASESARQIELAQLRAKQQLLQQGIDAGSTEGKQIIANAGEIERLNEELQLATASRGELESTFDSVASTWSDFIVQGKYDWNSFAQAGLSALKDIESEIIKLAAINPLKNMLFGTNLPTWDSVGGIFGQIFGSSSSSASSSGFGGFGVDFLSNWGVAHMGGMAGHANDNRMLPTSVLRFAPRLHSGAYLRPGEYPTILEEGERVLNRAETRDYNAGKGRPLTVNQYIQTPNPKAFQASKGQVMSSLVRGMRAAAARM